MLRTQNVRPAHLAIAACLLLAAAIATGGCQRERKTGLLAEYARDAKREGRTAITIREAGEQLDGALNSLLQSDSVVVASPLRNNIAVTADTGNIYTWSTFRIHKIVSRRAAAGYHGCRLKRPDRVAVGPNEAAIPNGGGTVTIDGVSITLTTDAWVPDDPQKKYVFFAMICSDEVMILPMYGQEVFELTPDGRLVLAYPRPYEHRLQYQREIAALGTLEVLKERIRSMAR